MAEQSDLLNALLAAGIKPSDSDEYSPEDIVEALADGLGVTPAIHCSGATGIGTQLSEVWICVDTDLAFMECPSIVKTTCTGDIAIPPVPSRVSSFVETPFLEHRRATSSSSPSRGRTARSSLPTV